MPQLPGLPDNVRDIVGRHLDAVDTARPGLVRALYLTGSIALGDYQPGRSDVDFMAFTSRVVDAGDVAALRDVHAGLESDTCHDGNYVSWQELPDVPLEGQPGPHVVEGTLRTGGNDQLTPSTWTEFASYAIAMRGPAAPSLGVSVSRSRLAAWNLGNLNGYWRDLARTIGRVAAERDPAGAARTDTVVWCVLGPPRLHYTLATGDITSKSGAGRYALDDFAEYQELIHAALSWRATGHGEFTNADARHAAEFMHAVVDDANRRWARD
jgi:Domain of unknown function (DUF4111)/Nucleotidyltransferase domain